MQLPENFVETTDSSGCTVVEMNDHSAGLLWLALIIAQVGVWMFASTLVQFLIDEILALALIGGLYFATRKHVRILIDTGRGVLTMGRRVIRLDQIVRAELGVVTGPRASGPGGGPIPFYRVELLLRSGERVPTIRGHGQFNPDDCHRLIDLINASIER